MRRTLEQLDMLRGAVESCECHPVTRQARLAYIAKVRAGVRDGTLRDARGDGVERWVRRQLPRLVAHCSRRAAHLGL